MKYIVLALSLFATSSFAQTNVPSSIKSQIPAGWTVKDAVTGQINNDTKEDLILVLENKKVEDVPRKIMIFLGEDSGYQLSGTSDTAVFCEKCGGIYGDPYNGIQVEKKKVIINNYTTFAYSRIDKQWQLIKVEKLSYHNSDPDKQKITIKLPKDFGKISLENFDPEKF